MRLGAILLGALTADTRSPTVLTPRSSTLEVRSLMYKRGPWTCAKVRAWKKAVPYSGHAMAYTALRIDECVLGEHARA